NSRCRDDSRLYLAVRGLHHRRRTKHVFRLPRSGNGQNEDHVFGKTGQRKLGRRAPRGLIARYFFLSPATTYAHSASTSSGFSRSPQGGMFLIPLVTVSTKRARS